MPQDCLFCKFISGEIRKDFLYENDDVVAFLDIHPVNPGHVLVVPKKHSTDLLDTEDRILGEIVIAAKKIGQALKDGLGYEAFNIGVNNGAAAHQLIMHTHWHVIPRRADDGLTPWAHKQYQEGEEAIVAEKIKKSLR